MPPFKISYVPPSFVVVHTVINVTATRLPCWTRICIRHLVSFSADINHPLEAVAQAPAAVMNPLQYLPPGLRNGALGWYPEQQKVWEKYGIPRYA